MAKHLTEVLQRIASEGNPQRTLELLENAAGTSSSRIVQSKPTCKSQQGTRLAVNAHHV